MNNEIIGKRLRSVRESAGFTQEQVAKYLEVKREVISYIETGARSVNTLMLRKLADLYGYKFSFFVDESVKEEEPQVSMAFRVSDLSDSDLRIVAQVKKIALNLDSLYSLLGG
jgi:transcriptional regulator with XRE-family HTH domain